jgi:glycosyltransferase involved in cell wall biosynthesis
VVRYTRHNDSITRRGILRTACHTIWNAEAQHTVRRLLREHRPDVMHCTNTFPLLSPSIYYAAAKERVPVVQALRNYRLLCLNSLLLRDGRICESCLGCRVSWPGVAHGCYRDQRLASTVVAAMLAVHRGLGTWTRRVTVFYTPSEFARQKFVEAGFSGERILVKPNFVEPDPGPGAGNGGYALFAGRLSAEKGLDLLLSAWQRLPLPIPLRIVGDGPLAPQVRAAAQRSAYIQYLGPRAHTEVLQLMGDAAFVVFPSVCYETFGRTIVESFARGTPVVAGRLGAMAELVKPNQTGWLFEPGQVDDLADILCRAITACNPGPHLRTAARQAYEAQFTAARNLQLLVGIYDRAVQLASTSGASDVASARVVPAGQRNNMPGVPDDLAKPGEGHEPETRHGFRPEAVGSLR